MPKDQISPWMPERDQLTLAVLGKMAEELNECAARIMRCIIQGIDEIDPDSERSNRDELLDEIADVEACLKVAVLSMRLASDPQRRAKKVAGFLHWHDLIRLGRKFIS